MAGSRVTGRGTSFCGPEMALFPIMAQKRHFRKSGPVTGPTRVASFRPTYHSQLAMRSPNPLVARYTARYEEFVPEQVRYARAEQGFSASKSADSAARYRTGNQRILKPGEKTCG